jgi:peptidoglycan L-alanyl-D-glutamate endopeptidase CwlK
MKHRNTPTCPRCEATLRDAAPELQEFARSVRHSDPEAHVSWAYRGKQDQEEALARGTTRAKFGDSPHNYLPALAVDFFRITPNGLAEWNAEWLKARLAIPARASNLVYGGDWKNFKDWPHVEVADWKSKVSK